MLNPNFDSRKHDVLFQLSSGEIDKSPKGFVDAPVVDLCNYINALPDIYTTSSCSGRITLFRHGDQTKGGQWLLATHSTTTVDEVAHSLLPGLNTHDAEIIRPMLSNQQLPDPFVPCTDEGVDIWFRFEAFILAVETRTLEAASQFVTVAHQAGYRESGITSITSRFISNVRGALRFDVPIVLQSKLCVSSDFLIQLVHMANERMVINHQKIDKFFQLLKHCPPLHIPATMTAYQPAQHHTKLTVKSNQNQATSSLDGRGITTSGAKSFLPTIPIHSPISSQDTLLPEKAWVVTSRGHTNILRELLQNLSFDDKTPNTIQMHSIESLSSTIPSITHHHPSLIDVLQQQPFTSTPQLTTTQYLGVITINKAITQLLSQCLPGSVYHASDDLFHSIGVTEPSPRHYAALAKTKQYIEALGKKRIEKLKKSSSHDIEYQPPLFSSPFIVVFDNPQMTGAQTTIDKHEQIPNEHDVSQLPPSTTPSTAAPAPAPKSPASQSEQAQTFNVPELWKLSNGDSDSSAEHIRPICLLIPRQYAQSVREALSSNGWITKSDRLEPPADWLEPYLHTVPLSAFKYLTISLTTDSITAISQGDDSAVVGAWHTLTPPSSSSSQSTETSQLVFAIAASNQQPVGGKWDRITTLLAPPPPPAAATATSTASTLPDNNESASHGSGLFLYSIPSTEHAASSKNKCSSTPSLVGSKAQPQTSFITKITTYLEQRYQQYITNGLCRGCTPEIKDKMIAAIAAHLPTKYEIVGACCFFPRDAFHHTFWHQFLTFDADDKNRDQNTTIKPVLRGFQSSEQDDKSCMEKGYLATFDEQILSVLFGSNAIQSMSIRGTAPAHTELPVLFTDILAAYCHLLNTTCIAIHSIIQTDLIRSPQTIIVYTTSPSNVALPAQAGLALGPASVIHVRKDSGKQLVLDPSSYCMATPSLNQLRRRAGLPRILLVSNRAKDLTPASLQQTADLVNTQSAHTSTTSMASSDETEEEWDAQEANRRMIQKMTQDGEYWTLHNENRRIYVINIIRSMFSSGNGTEKQRAATYSKRYPLTATPPSPISTPTTSTTTTAVNELECILDMYAGIGYFTIPMMFSGTTSTVYACELNPYAVTGLLNAVHLNRKQSDISRMLPTPTLNVIPGDNRRAVVAYILRHRVDRVSLGLIPTCQEGLTNALFALNPRGGMLHIHWNVDVKQFKPNSEECTTKTASSKKQMMLETGLQHVSTQLQMLLQTRIDTLNRLINDMSIATLYDKYKDLLPSYNHHDDSCHTHNDGQHNVATTTPSLGSHDATLDELRGVGFDIVELLSYYEVYLTHKHQTSEATTGQNTPTFCEYLQDQLMIGQPAHSSHCDTDPIWSKSHWNQVKVVNTCVVKSYAPHVYHVVFDVLIGDEVHISKLPWYQQALLSLPSTTSSSTKTTTTVTATTAPPKPEKHTGQETLGGQASQQQGQKQRKQAAPAKQKYNGDGEDYEHLKTLSNEEFYTASISPELQAWFTPTAPPQPGSEAHSDDKLVTDKDGHTTTTHHTRVIHPFTGNIIANIDVTSSPVTNYTNNLALRQVIEDIYSQTDIKMTHPDEHEVIENIVATETPSMTSPLEVSHLARCTAFSTSNIDTTHISPHDLILSNSVQQIIHSKPHPIPIIEGLSHEQFIDVVLPLSKPIVIRGHNIGSCIEKWKDNQYLVQNSRDIKVNIHIGEDPALNMRPRNYKFKTVTFEEMFDVMSQTIGYSVTSPHEAGTTATTTTSTASADRIENAMNTEKQSDDNQSSYTAQKPKQFAYLRSMGANSRTDVAHFDKSFPHLAKDFIFPSFIPKSAYFSSVFRVSSPCMQLWPHFDVADNFLVHVRGRKRVTMFAPLYAGVLGIEPSPDASSAAFTRLDLKAMFDEYQISRSHPSTTHTTTLCPSVTTQSDPDGGQQHIEGEPSQLEQYLASHKGLLYAYRYRHEVILEPGDILFIPTLWIHHVESLNDDIPISVNIFWRHLKQSLYQKKDVYGNKDLINGAVMLSSANELVTKVHSMPIEYQRFYLLRCTELLLKEMYALRKR